MSELVALQQRGFDPFGAIMRGQQAAQQSKLSDLMMQNQKQNMQWAQEDRQSAITANKEALRQKILGNAYKALTNPEMTRPDELPAAWQAVNQQLNQKFGFGLGSDQYSDDALRGLGIETGALQSGGGVEFGKSAQIGVDPETGERVYFAMGSDGRMRSTGVKAGQRLQKIDLPDGRVQFYDTERGVMVDPGQAATGGNGNVFDEAEARKLEQLRAAEQVKAEGAAAKKEAETAQAAKEAVPIVDELLSLTQKKYYTGTLADSISQGLAKQGVVSDPEAAENTQRVRLLAQRLSFQGKPPGLGQVTEGEWKRITDAVGDPNLPAPQFRAALETLRKMLVQASQAESGADLSIDDLVNQYSGQ